MTTILIICGILVICAAIVVSVFCYKFGKCLESIDFDITSDDLDNEHIYQELYKNREV